MIRTMLGVAACLAVASAMPAASAEDCIGGGYYYGPGPNPPAATGPYAPMPSETGSYGAAPGGGHGAASQRGPGGGGYEDGNTVRIYKHAYEPATLTVKTGSTVRWINNDSDRHTATGEGFDVELAAGGGEGSHTFPTAGTFEVSCRFHPDMKGRIVVQAAADAPAASDAPAPGAPMGSTAPSISAPPPYGATAPAASTGTAAAIGSGLFR